MTVIRDYYEVRLPIDLFENREDYFDYAIAVARERARLWCTPVDWTVIKTIWDDGGEHMFQVRRSRKDTANG